MQKKVQLSWTSFCDEISTADTDQSDLINQGKQQNSVLQYWYNPSTGGVMVYDRQAIQYTG